MTTIRSLVPDDHADWLPLWQSYLRFYETSLDDAQTALTFERMTAAEPSIHGAIARDADGRAVGIVHWLTHATTWAAGPYCYLEDLFVSPDVRGGGVGRALIAHVRAWAESSECDALYWLTQSSNTTARALYDRIATDTGFAHYQVDLTH